MGLLSVVLAAQVVVGPGEPTEAVVRRATEAAARSVDENAFDYPPRRPSHGAIRLLLADYSRTHAPETLQRVDRALERIARSVLRDHLGGGFYRGDVEGLQEGSRFEKRLCDNALFLRWFARAQGATRSLLFRDVAKEIVAWSIREMHDSTGAFWSSIGGQSEEEDRKYYLWSREEIVKALDAERSAEYFRTYRLVPPGMLVLDGSPFAGLDPAREVLLGRRVRRVRPAMDQSIRAGWNGLMISGLAATGSILKRGSDLEAARRAAGAVVDRMGPANTLRSKAGEAATLEDYAYLGEGLLDLHEATGEPRWRADAMAVADAAVTRLWDVSGGGFFDGEAGSVLPHVRPRNGRDVDLPAPNGVMASLLLRLGRLTGEKRYTQLGRRTIGAFAEGMEREPGGMETLAAAAADGLRLSAAPALTPAGAIAR